MSITEDELLEKFDAGESVLEYFDLSRATRPGLEKQQVTLGVPAWIIEQAERESARIGITPESMLNIWVEKMAEQSAQRLSICPSRPPA